MSLHGDESPLLAVAGTERIVRIAARLSSAPATGPEQGAAPKKPGRSIVAPGTATGVAHVAFDYFHSLRSCDMPIS